MGNLWTKVFGRKFRSLHLERLEDRIVLDASLGAVDADHQADDDGADQIAHHDAPDAPGGSSAAAMDGAVAHSGSADPAGDLFGQSLDEVLITSNIHEVVLTVPAPGGAHVLLISSDVENAADLVAAAQDGVIVLTYDHAADSPDDLIQSIADALGGRRAE